MWKSLTAKPTATDFVENSLKSHEMELLMHQEAIDYHTRMAQYSEDIIRRLKEFKPLNPTPAKA